jgi:menaquinone-dependent protoporphyrinogen oxidase
VYSKYNWLLKRVMRRIVRKKESGRYTDMSRDYEFTDFGEVRAFARDFGAAVGYGSSRSGV